MNTIRLILVGMVLLCVGSWARGGKTIGKVTYVEGDAFFERAGKDLQKLSVNAKVQKGDKVSTGVESILELTLSNGTVLRFAENTKSVLDEGINEGNVRMESGKLWANVKKMQKGGFSVTTPVATAAVRGTVFRVESSNENGSTVSLYEGLVDVGPADSTQIAAITPPATGWGPPVQVPGPYEVSLNEWVRLHPGKQIHVQSTGKFATKNIDKQKEASDKWVEFNRTRDRSVPR